jgi:Tol biopolymer transport system component
MRQPFFSTPRYRGLLALSALVALAACGGGTTDEAPTSEAAADDSRSTALAKRRVPPPPPPPPAPPPPPSPPVDSTVVGALALASSTSAGQATGGYAPCGISADGNLIAFTSGSNSLVAGDTNGVDDVFVKNLLTGAVQRVSTSATGAQLASASSCRQMTPDGRFVLLGGSNSAGLTLKNVQTGATTAIYPAANSIPNNTGFSGGSMSDDANVIAFVTQPTQTYVGAYQWVNNVPARIMLRNLATGTLTTLATDNGSTAAGEIILGHLNARVSPDGQRVAFVSSSSTLVGGDTNGQADVFVRHLASGLTTVASSSSAGAPALLTVCCFQSYYRVEWVNSAVLQFSIDQAHNLGPVGEYVKNIDTGALQLLLASSDGAGPVMSADMSKLVFSQLYGSGFDRRIFSRDLATGAEQVVSSSSSGVAGNGNANVGLISRDGARVVFNANATNLFSPAPPAGTFQVYVKTIDTP